MYLPIILGIAVGFVILELGFVLPWIISNSVLSAGINVALFIFNLLSLYYLIHHMIGFYQRHKKKKKTKLRK